MKVVDLCPELTPLSLLAPASIDKHLLGPVMAVVDTGHKALCLVACLVGRTSGNMSYSMPE